MLPGRSGFGCLSAPKKVIGTAGLTTLAVDGVVKASGKQEVAHEKKTQKKQDQ